MENLCEGLELGTLLYLGIYDPAQYVILEVHSESRVRGELPTFLSAQLLLLLRTLSPDVQVDYMTLVHNGQWLKGVYEEEVTLNLLQHPYVFYDVKKNTDHSCIVKSAVYSTNCAISRQNIRSTGEGALGVNPIDIYCCEAEVTVHHDNNGPMFSPNNARFSVKTSFPVHVFYSLTLVPYKGRIVKTLVAKHVLVLDEEPVLPTIGLKASKLEKGKKELLEEAKGLLMSVLNREFDVE